MKFIFDIYMVLFALVSVAMAQKPANTTEMESSNSNNNSTSAGPPPSKMDTNSLEIPRLTLLSIAGLCTSYPDNGICHVSSARLDTNMSMR